MNWRFWIDRGGTFTDIVAQGPDGRFETAKLLSENPERYADAAVAGVQRFLGLAEDGRSAPGERIDHVKMGTTVATNALLERKGARTLLVVNRGFADVLEIGHQARPRLFDLKIEKPAPLYEAVLEAAGRVSIEGGILEPLDEEGLKADLDAARARGLEACAVSLLHAWKHPDTEARIGELARAAGLDQVSLSQDASPLMGYVARTATTLVDAYLSPVLRRYVDRVSDALGGATLYFMQSNGGLAAPHRFQGKDAVLSGPAGGVVGAARTAETLGFSKIVGFDMGGTSTDVALYDGAFERVFDAQVAGVDLRAPMMDIHTVAAGGGSKLVFDGARFRVGPDSAGADPGPACYRRGGPATVTDANVILGKIRPAGFPAIFGPEGDQPLDADAARAAFDALADEIEAATGERRSLADIAEGFVRVAVSNMARAIKKITLDRGRDAAEFALQCFGGAGGQHACLVADELGMETVLIHPYAGVLSAFGMGLADQSVLRRQALERPLDREALAAAEAALDALEQAALSEFDDGAPPEISCAAELRYDGTDTALTVPFGAINDMRAAFDAAHQTRFGFSTSERRLVLQSVTLEASRRGQRPRTPALPAGQGQPEPLDDTELWSGGRAHPCPVYDRAALRAGDEIAGPALIAEDIATTVVEPGWMAETAVGGELILKRVEARQRRPLDADGPPDPVRLELFNNMFMGLAERMGAVLRDTATSVNIKERLDFSCALFDAEGGLVANAPHVPVHLGAMGESVRAVLEARRDTLKPGDMVALNDPSRGGTHLPDVTVVAPIFDPDGCEIRFFVANRGHHADIGGTTPGSTPPDSTRLDEEGVVISDVLILDGGVFQEDAFRKLLADAPHPARNPDANVSDIKAQAAANRAGIEEIDGLVAKYGWPGVRAYMARMMDNAEASVRRVIGRLKDGVFDYEMDDGARLKVAIRVDQEAGSAEIDFTGTSPARPGNFNAPPAVARAAALYAFRCLVDDDLPLNEGCLRPLTLITPEGSFLAPGPGAAVVAGNTEVSQALCNALFGALGACAASQGTMNNLLLGDAAHQYYETIGGGTGAGAGFDGASAVQSHMTNTRITDPEVLELRHPLRVERFAVRRGSGGDGRWRGGDGTVRKLRALAPMTMTLVASRRETPPFGLDGGADGAAGRQWIERADGTVEPLGGRARADLAAGDAIVIETPGGGGFGLAD